MVLTIEQYIEYSFVLKDKLELESLNIFQENMEIIYQEVARRMQIDIAPRYICSYDIDSCIVPLSGKYYHIIDLSMFKYFFELLVAIERDEPNYATYIYRKIRRDICLSKYDKKEAPFYEVDVMHFNTHEMEVEMLKKEFSEDQIDQYACMLRFYFLHEYAHYFAANPIRKASNGIADLLVKTLLEYLADKDHPLFNDVSMKIVQKKMLEYYTIQWNDNPKFREEIYCDVQAILCLMEIIGASYEEISIEMILKSIMTFIYIQYAIYLAKHVGEPINWGSLFGFRKEIIAWLAYLLMDEEWAEMLYKLLKHSNKFFVAGRMQAKSISWKKQEDFYMWFMAILNADREKIVKDGRYQFPFFVQPKYDFSVEYLKENNIPEWITLPCEEGEWSLKNFR